MSTDFSALTDYELAMNWREAINHANQDFPDNIRQQVFAECDKRRLTPETLLKLLTDFDDSLVLQA